MTMTRKPPEGAGVRLPYDPFEIVTAGRRCAVELQASCRAAQVDPVQEARVETDVQAQARTDSLNEGHRPRSRSVAVFDRRAPRPGSVPWPMEFPGRVDTGQAALAYSCSTSAGVLYSRDEVKATAIVEDLDVLEDDCAQRDGTDFGDRKEVVGFLWEVERLRTRTIRIASSPTAQRGAFGFGGDGGTAITVSTRMWFRYVPSAWPTECQPRPGPVSASVSTMRASCPRERSWIEFCGSPNPRRARARC